MDSRDFSIHLLAHSQLTRTQRASTVIGRRREKWIWGWLLFNLKRKIIKISLVGFGTAPEMCAVTKYSRSRSRYAGHIHCTRTEGERENDIKFRSEDLRCDEHRLQLSSSLSLVVRLSAPVPWLREPMCPRCRMIQYTYMHNWCGVYGLRVSGKTFANELIHAKYDLLDPIYIVGFIQWISLPTNSLTHPFYWFPLIRVWNW